MPAARIHEAIAKKINKVYNMDEVLLRFETIAPDCRRNSTSTNKYVTHFWNFDIQEGEANDYDRFYLKYKNEINNPFYSGYLIHLMADQYWKTNIDSKYFFKVNGINMCKLKDGKIRE